MDRTHRARAGLLATTLLLALGACGGTGDDDGADDAPRAVTLEDLKPREDHFSRRLDPPADLDVPERWDLITDSLKLNLARILERSFTDPDTWRLSSDADAVGAVVAGFSSIGDENVAHLAETLLGSERDAAADDERIATRWASTFTADALPQEAYVFKVKWKASAKGSTATLRAVVWAGYEVRGEPLVVAREFSLEGIDQGASVGYSMNLPVHGGVHDLCAAVREGVLEPPEDGIPEEVAAALREEFADTDFRPLTEAFAAVEQAADASGDRGEREDRVQACLEQ